MTVHTVTHKRTNMYIIGGNDKYVLFDCLWHDSFSVIKHALKERGIAFEQIAGLFVSHFHPDHAGTFELLRRHGIPPMVLEHQMLYTEWLNDFFKKPKNDPNGQYVPIDIKTLMPITPDTVTEVMGYCGINGKILRTLGHSEDGVSLIAENAVFVGDLPRFETAEVYGNEVAENWRDIFSCNITEIYYAHIRLDVTAEVDAKIAEEICFDYTNARRAVTEDGE